jgi:hypothetical protein
VAAPAKYESVEKQLLRLATSAKLRGLTFEQWWQEALPVRVCTVCGLETLMTRCPRPLSPTSFQDCDGRTRGPKPWTVQEGGPPTAVLWPTDTTDRRLWLAAVDSSKEGWRRAFEAVDHARSDHAFGLLREHLDHAASWEDGAGNERAVAVG